MKQAHPAEVVGKFIGNERGFGFVVQEDPMAEDIFIPPSMTGGALHGDEVLCRLTVKKPERAPVKKGRRTPKALKNPAPAPPEGGRQTGQIIEITHRKPLIGTYFTIGNEGYVRPIDGKIPYVFTVSPKTRNRFGLADGHRVVFLAHKPKPSGDDTRRRRPVIEESGYGTALPCSIVEVMGHIHDPGMDVLTLVRQFDIPYQFPEDVMTQAAALPDVITEEDIKGRFDLRSQHIITVDGEDTKDIDDAISLTQTPDGSYKLGVHIADVSHYVKPGTPLDEEALNRGTSVYLADRVIPMLPHRLSSGVCSLFPGVDRLTLSCMMTVDSEGNVLEYEIAPSVINSKRRWTYNEVQGVLDASRQHKSVEERSDAAAQVWTASASPCDDDGVPCYTPNDKVLFLAMDNLRGVLSQKRHKRGALDFDLPEAKIKVDETGHPISIEPYQRSQATGIIEEFMILANETIAVHCQSNNIPLIYRAHDAPAPEKFAMLAGIAKAMGFTIPGHSKGLVVSKSESRGFGNCPPTRPGPKAIQRLSETAESSPAYHALAMAVLTSLPQAIYTPDSPKHFGLGSDAYCHFTSPIRRYADLQVHRIIKKALENNADGAVISAPGITASSQDAKGSVPDWEALTSISAQCSRTERAAEALEREVAQLKKVQFMQGQEGKIFEGTISGITPWGAYVMLANTIEGLIPSQHLKSHGFTYDKDKNRYVNKHRREAMPMGANITVRLSHANEEERKLNFALLS